MRIFLNIFAFIDVSLLQMASYVSYMKANCPTSIQTLETDSRWQVVAGYSTLPSNNNKKQGPRWQPRYRPPSQLRRKCHFQEHIFFSITSRFWKCVLCFKVRNICKYTPYQHSTASITAGRLNQKVWDKGHVAYMDGYRIF
jgi:hypothetical protein